MTSTHRGSLHRPAALIWRSLAGLALAAASVSALAAQAPVGEMQARFERVRELSGANPAQARLEIASLRSEALARKQFAWRLALDELECRILSDIDVPAARRVAAAGIATASSQADLTLPLLRLQACHAGVLIDSNSEREGADELEIILRRTGNDPSLTAARAMALLERGLRRSRRGELASGQEDLLWACRSFDALALRADQELCLSHLANHQKRAGDYDAALNNLTQLLDSARRRQARQDEGIYLYNIALVRAEQGQWEPARAAYADALAIETAKDDAMGIVYAEHGLADALLELKRPDEALAHIELAQKRCAEVDDLVQLMRVGIVHARALAATGRPAEAAERLRLAEPAVRASTDRLLLGLWLRPQAEVQALLGHWREAYEAQIERRDIDAALQAQRLSGQLSRLRLQFDRERDEAAIRSLQQANLQGQQLRQVQAVALTLFVLLLLATLAYAVQKLREGRRLQTLALQDELTQLANRRAVFAHAAQLLPQARSRRSPLSVLMIDVDHFKQVNDTHGHAIGDQVLKHLAALLPASLRSLDRLGRIGGEEFLALLPDATLEQATAIAERMRASVAGTPLATPDGALAPTISIGVATLSGAAESVEALVERADRALYRAKAEGRNRVAGNAG